MIVEFAIISVAFLAALVGTVEFARLLYVRNTLQEVTRTAARMATVSGFSQRDQIKRAALFHAGTREGTVSLPGGGEVTDADIQITYYDLNGVEIPAGSLPLNPLDNGIACRDPARVSSCVRFVRVMIARDNGAHVRYQPLSGAFKALSLDLPYSTVVTSAESLGLDYIFSFRAVTDIPPK
jgi:hypothetical protein